MIDLGTHGLADSDLPDRFRRFAAVETLGVSPLYEAMARAAAEMPLAMALAAHRQAAQPPVNMLFGAIHRLLQAGEDHPLRAFYPMLSPRPRPPAAVGPVLADFLATRADRLAAIIAARRVSTNEIGRSAGLMLALAHGLALLNHNGPLALIDAGASAGLNLYPDRIGFDFGHGRRTGPDPAPVHLPVPMEPADAPAPAALPAVIARTGIDLHPLDPTDPQDAAWLRALVWPEAGARMARLDAALALARAEPHRMVRADAVEAIGGLVAEQPGEALVCVTHSIMMYQLPEPQRRAFHDRLLDASRGRPVLRASLEWRRGESAPSVQVSAYADGAQTFRETLASADPHGRWLKLV
jgi:hypothetical protein